MTVAVIGTKTSFWQSLMVDVGSGVQGSVWQHGVGICSGMVMMGDRDLERCILHLGPRSVLKSAWGKMSRW
jgi:hypothetical protein